MTLCVLTTLLVLILASSADASKTSKPVDNSDSEYDIQSLLWEHDTIFNGVLEWAYEKHFLTSSQVKLMQNELENRLRSFADNEASDVHARRKIYTFISSRLSVPALLAGFGLILLSLVTLAAVVVFISTPLVTLVSVIGICIWWWIASSLGQSVQWQVLGVCIFAIPVALVGTASYGLLIAFGLPETPYEFLLPEASTIAVSMLVFYRFGFTFLLVPALVASYFLWIDITCIVNGKKGRMDPSLFSASWVFGLATIVFGAIQESESSHLGFWFYMVGGFAFVGGLLPFILMSPDLFNEVVFLTSAAGMIYSGTTIQRSVLLVYGALGITIYVIKSALTLGTSCNVSNSAMYFRALFAVLFFSMSVIRYVEPAEDETGRFKLASYAGFAEYGCGFWLLVLHTLTWPPNVAKLSPNARYRSLTFTAHLVTTIGLVGLSRVMRHMKFGVIQMIATEDLDCGTIVAFVAGWGLILNHCSALILDIGVGLGIANQASHGSYHPQGSSSLIKPGTTITKDHFSGSRLIIIVLIGLLSHVLPTTTFALSSVVSLLFLSWVEFIYKSPNALRKEAMVGLQWLVSTSAFLLSYSFDLRYWQAICFLCMAVFTQMAIKRLKSILLALLAGWFAIGIFLDSKLIQGMSCLFVILTLLQVAKHTKSPKYRAIHVATIFTMAVFALSAGYVFLHYDYYRHLERGLLFTSTQQVADAFDWVRTGLTHLLGAESSDFSLLHSVAKLVAWPLPLSNALIAEGHYVLAILVLIGVITALTEGGTWIYTRVTQETPIDESVPGAMIISQMTVHFPNDTSENGIVIGLKGEKPEGFEMDNATLHVLGDEFWNTLSVMYGATEIEAFRKLHYPFKLFPHRASKKHFHSSDQQIWLQFGTGLLKEPAFSQSNIRSTLRKLVSNGDPEFTIRVIYSSRKATPKKALLFEFDIRPGLILNSIREGFQLKPLLTDW